MVIDVDTKEGQDLLDATTTRTQRCVSLPNSPQKVPGHFHLGFPSAPPQSLQSLAHIVNLWMKKHYYVVREAHL